MPANLHPVAGLFERTLPRIHGSQKLVDVVVDKTTGKKKVNGKSKALKRSGEYPLQFGLAIGFLAFTYWAASAYSGQGFQNVSNECALKVMIIHSTFGYVTCVASPQFGFELCSKGLTKLLLPSTVLFLSMILLRPSNYGFIYYMYLLVMIPLNLG